MEDAASSQQDTENERVLQLARIFDANVERVFQAWTDPACLVKWWGPRGITVPELKIDLREGGAWAAMMRSAQGEVYRHSGVYRQIEPNRRLVFSWAWDNESGRGHETEVEVEFRAVGGRTELRLTQRLFADGEQCRKHDQGWSSSLDCLAEYLVG